jgi:hypothetical protein
MGLFGKKSKEEVPSLPELPSSGELVLPSKDDLLDSPPEVPEIEVNDLPPLPKMGNSELPQEQIKNTISPPDLPTNNLPVPDMPEKMQKSNFEIPKPSKKHLNAIGKEDLPRTIEIEKGMSNQTFERALVKKAEPVYVRLDKFEETVEIFEEIKKKIKDMEEVLQKTREIKQKEEDELIEWEREIQIIKTRIDSIDKNIFNKLD